MALGLHFVRNNCASHRSAKDSIEKSFLLIGIINYGIKYYNN
ncbi:hypothetical protein FRUB_05416 [Fimbriiglobus ruber]|uniref:Uncharacterized protein n=1 Tax=Fimbriiglobus ruber TaxID=1908690 RepID=A0A225DWC2_9BACT|nr:hypothetical protein FRUB_05416 [Fimbriiglobus ruber]